MRVLDQRAEWEEGERRRQQDSSRESQRAVVLPGSRATAERLEDAQGPARCAVGCGGAADNAGSDVVKCDGAADAVPMPTFREWIVYPVKLSGTHPSGL